MKIAVYYSNNDIRIKEEPMPSIGPDEILMKVEASGICGSDVMQWYRIDRVPLVLGHEVSGIIEDVGKSLLGFRKGDRIAVSHHVPCGKCNYCLWGHESACQMLRETNFYPGGFCQYVRIPAVNIRKNGVYKIPRTMSFDEATFTEPLACVLRANRLANFKKGKSVLVLGSGISGLLHIQLAKFMKASKIFATDINKWRLEKAKRFGADFCFRANQDLPSLIKENNDGNLIETVILTTGAKSALMQAIECVDRGGTILFFAAANKDVTIELNVNDIFWRNEVTLTSSYAASPREHLEALEMIKNKKIKVTDLITHRFGLNDIVKGFNLVEKAEESIKVIIEPQK